MKVLIYQKGREIVKNSGVGMAITHQIDSINNKYNDIELVLNEKDKYDVIHLNTILPSSYFQSLKAKKEGKTVIYHAHSTEEDFRNSFIGSNIFSKLFKYWICKCYNTADVIITPSEYSKMLIEGYGIKKKIKVLSNGIDTKYYQKKSEDREEFIKKYGFQEDDKIIISVGLPIERKGILDFVKLAKEMPTYKFVWFGDTSISMLPAKIKEIIKDNDLPNLYFPGFAKKEEIRQAYSAADVFLFLTHEETEGIVLLEALSMKTPTIIRDIPVFNWIENQKQIYKGNNIAEFKNLINKLTKEDVSEVLEEGRKLVMKKDINNVGANLREIYLNSNKIEENSNKYLIPKLNFKNI